MATIKFSKDEAVKYREQGFSFQEIADLMGASIPWVSKALRGVPRGQKRVAVDGTRLKAIAILTEALRQVKAL